MMILSIHLLVFEVFECDRYLILSFLIENDFKRSCVVIDLEQSAHWLIMLGSHSSNNDDLKQRKQV